jgi:hypothetical protein
MLGEEAAHRTPAADKVGAIGEKSLSRRILTAAAAQALTHFEDSRLTVMRYVSHIIAHDPQFCRQGYRAAVS